MYTASEMVGKVNGVVLTRIPHQHVVMRLLLVLRRQCADATSAAGGRRRNTWPAGCDLYRRRHDTSRRHSPASSGVRSSPPPPALLLSMHPKVATLHTVDQTSFTSGGSIIWIEKKVRAGYTAGPTRKPTVRIQLYFMYTDAAMLVIAREVPVHLQTRCACRQPEAGGGPGDAISIAIPHRLLRPASRLTAPIPVKSAHGGMGSRTSETSMCERNRFVDPCRRRCC